MDKERRALGMRRRSRDVPAVAYAPEPVPFRVSMPGSDTLGLEGARSVSVRVEGLLRVEGASLRVEWRIVRHVEQVSLTSIDVNDESTPIESIDIPIDEIADARLTGGWWAPRLRMRARKLDAFDGVPGAGPGTIMLRIARRDRRLATTLADALAVGVGGTRASE